jgi:hypothetical protein
MPSIPPMHVIQNPAAKVLFVYASFASLMEGIITRFFGGVPHLQGSFHKGALGLFVRSLIKSLDVDEHVEIVLLDLLERCCRWALLVYALMRLTKLS